MRAPECESVNPQQGFISFVKHPVALRTPSMQRKGAVALANDSRSKNIEPLHLLAAMIQCDADISERLNRHDVRLDAVLAAIRSSDQ